MERDRNALVSKLYAVLFLLCQSVGSNDLKEHVLRNNVSSSSSTTNQAEESKLSLTLDVNDGLISTKEHVNNPEIIQNLTLELSNTSPAVLDSTVVFLAKLRDYSGHLVDSNKFEYVWHDRQKSEKKITWDKFNSSISRVYRGDQHTAGTYTMMVTVMKDRQILAVKTMDYHLTGRLNGNMTVYQDLSYQRQKNVLSTDHPMSLRAQIHDKFRSPSSKVEYHWYIDGQPVGISDKPELNLSLAQPGLKRMAVRVAIDIISDVLILPRYVNKTGYFSQVIILKDPLDNMKIEGGEAVPMNSLFYLNISCVGSGPTSICWYVSPIPMSGEGGNLSCSPTVFLQTCQHLVNLSLPNPGKYRFSVLIINDVSQLEKQWYLYVYDPDSANIPAITVPVVFAFLAIIIIVIGGAYIVKLRKKPYVEVADFDFHPSLTREAEDSKISVKIRRTVRRLMLSQSFKNTPRPVESTFKVYGSVEEENAGL